MPQTVALTFDDGPNPDGTRRVLELLDRHGVEATFFVWGEQAQRHPEVVREVLDAGHSVQPHCWAHVSHWTLEPSEIAADIDAVSALLAQIGVPAGTLWRPPYGRALPGATRAIAAERGLALAGWTINPHDYAGHGAEEMHDVMTAGLIGQGHSIVLLHDGHREPGQLKRRADASNTVELVAMLLERDAVTFTTLSRGLDTFIDEDPPEGA